jgi:hypothetical protein
MDLAKKVGASKVYCHSEVTYEEDLTEKRVAAALKTEDIQLKACWGSTLYSPDELPFKLGDMPATHGPFLDLLESTHSKIPHNSLGLCKCMRDCGGDALAARSTDSSVNLILAFCRGVQKCGGFFACPAAREGSWSAQGQAIGMPGHFPWRHPHHRTVGPSAAVQNPWCPQVQRRWVQHMQPMFPLFLHMWKYTCTRRHTGICKHLFHRLHLC